MVGADERLCCQHRSVPDLNRLYQACGAQRYAIRLPGCYPSTPPLRCWSSLLSRGGQGSASQEIIPRVAPWLHRPGRVFRLPVAGLYFANIEANRKAVISTAIHPCHFRQAVCFDVGPRLSGVSCHLSPSDLSRNRTAPLPTKPRQASRNRTGTFFVGGRRRSRLSRVVALVPKLGALSCRTYSLVASPLRIHQQEKERSTLHVCGSDRDSELLPTRQYSFARPRSFLLAPDTYAARVTGDFKAAPGLTTARNDLSAFGGFARLRLTHLPLSGESSTIHQHGRQLARGA